MNMPSTMMDESGSIAMIYIQTEAEIQALASSTPCRLFRVTIKFRNGSKNPSKLGTNEAVEGRLSTSCQDLVTVVRMLEQSGRRAAEIWMQSKGSGYLSQSDLRAASKVMHNPEFQRAK